MKNLEIGLKIIKEGKTHKFINGPISKKSFLSKKYPGITEYIARKTSIKKYAMLIYNKDLSVCPLTTHIPIKMFQRKLIKKIFVKKFFD